MPKKKYILELKLDLPENECGRWKRGLGRCCPFRMLYEGTSYCIVINNEEATSDLISDKLRKLKSTQRDDDCPLKEDVR